VKFKVKVKARGGMVAPRAVLLVLRAIFAHRRGAEEEVAPRAFRYHVAR